MQPYYGVDLYMDAKVGRRELEAELYELVYT